MDRVIRVQQEKQARPGVSHSMLFYPQLNGLRFVFIFMVLIHHWGPQAFFEQYRSGWLGVDLFFVLSGFLIGEILLLEKERTRNNFLSIKNFVMRRILRIFPLYYLTIFLYAVLVTTGGIFIWNITYANNILQTIDLERVGEEFWHLWSLCVEEQFYLVFPFFVFFVKRKLIPFFLIAGIILSALGRFIAVTVYHNPAAYTLMPLCLDSLLMGVMLAYLKNFRFDQLQKFFLKKYIVAFCILLSSLIIGLLCYSQNGLMIYSFFRLFGSLLGFLLIGYSVIIKYGSVIKHFLENKYIALFGKISYGIYLLHPFIEKLYFTYAGNNPVRQFLINSNLPGLSNRYIIDFVSLFTITVAISYLSFQFFEKRFLKLKLLYTSS